MIVKGNWRKGKRLSDHVLTEELKFVLETLRRHRQITTITIEKLEREPDKVFVGFRSTKESFGSEIISRKDLSYLKRRFEGKITFTEN